MKKQGPNNHGESVRGKAHLRFNSQRGTYRFRFNGVHKDQAEVILGALEKARMEASTDYDTVALDRICIAYLASIIHLGPCDS